MSGEFEKNVIEETEEQKIPFDIKAIFPAMDEKVTVRMTAETKKSLEKMATKYHVSVSELIRQLTERGLKFVKINQQK